MGIFDRPMRVLHPFMPFVTEEICRTCTAGRRRPICVARDAPNCAETPRCWRASNWRLVITGAQQRPQTEELPQEGVLTPPGHRRRELPRRIRLCIGEKYTISRAIETVARV